MNNLTLSDIADEIGSSSPIKDLLKKLNPSILISEESVERVREMLKNFHEIGERTMEYYPVKHRENVVAIKMRILGLIDSETPTPDLAIQE
jgi:hypothetical protein